MRRLLFQLILAACFVSNGYAEQSLHYADHNIRQGKSRSANGRILRRTKSIPLHYDDDESSSPLAFLASRKEDFKLESDGPIDRDALEQQQQSGPSFWPPWPFSMLNSINNNAPSQTHAADASSPSYQSAASVAWSVTKTTAKVSVRNLQEFGSQLWFHSPPAAPPLILYALIPRRQNLMQHAEGTANTALIQTLMHETVIPMWSNPLIRNLALTATGLAIMSWAHAELHRHRRLTALPLTQSYRDMNRAELPPFLPDQVPTTLYSYAAVDDDSMAPEDGEDGASATVVVVTKNKKDGEEETADVNRLPPRLRRHLQQFLREKTPTPATFGTSIAEWKRGREFKRAERKNAHRLAVYDELVALQAIKKKAASRKRQQQRLFGLNPRYKVPSNTTLAETNETSLGYALVTGASKGIGRAIAVELARWEIPLILVARDVDALTDLAYDIEACYGVDCCVLPADLSTASASQRIYKAVSDAGLKVDVSWNALPLYAGFRHNSFASARC